MLDYLVLYNSQSGNTKSVAAAIFSALPPWPAGWRRAATTPASSWWSGSTS